MRHERVDVRAGRRFRDRLESMMTNVFAGWPPGSPDLNPVENLRILMKIRVEEGKPSTKSGLIDMIVAACQKPAMTLVNLLVASLPRRVQEHRNNEGDLLCC
jgi:hypothetical protein